MFLGLTAAISLTYTISHYTSAQFLLLMPAMYASAAVILIIDFQKLNQAVLLRFIARLILTGLIIFGLFPDMPIPEKIVVSLYVFTVLSFLTYAVTDNFQYLSIFSFVMFIFNVLAVLFLQRTPFIADYGFQFHILVAVSTFSVLSYFVLLNIDVSRQFGMDMLNIPGTTKRAVIIVIAVVIAFMLVFTFMPWILQAVEAFLLLIRNAIIGLLSLIPSSDDPIPANGSGGEDPFLFIEGDEGASETSIFARIFMWIIVGLSILAMFAAIIFALVKMILFIFRLFKKRHQRVAINSEVYIETIEKITPTRKKRALRNYFRRPRYSSLRTERERIAYIYSEYVKRAKNKGLTRDYANDTATEVLDEVESNLKDETFPLPENLATLFNTAIYSNIDAYECGADELKKRLL